MESVAIFPLTGADGLPVFRAVAKAGLSEGRTAGEALDAIRLCTPMADSGTVVVIQPFRPDSHFTATQHARLTELMERWRWARDASKSLERTEQAELDSLIEKELTAATARSCQILKRLGE